MQALILSQPEMQAKQNSCEPWLSWLPVVALPTLVLAFFPESLPRWAFMWAVAFATYCGCKWLTWKSTPMPDAPLWKHLGYLFAWPGLDAGAFLRCGKEGEVGRTSGREWCFAFAKLLLGLLVLFAGPRIMPSQYPYLVGWVGMIGIVMVLHFGLFHILSCAWRAMRVNARPLMNWPLVSGSITDFWGKRWNSAFRDLTHRFAFRPLVPLWGARGSLLAVFLLSGLVHELVISVPAQGGYGGPTLFFVIQGVAIFVSRSSFGRSIGLTNGISGWVFAALVLLGPAPLLFHPPFVSETVLPLLSALGAL